MKPNPRQGSRQARSTRDWLDFARRQFAGSASARLDAEILLAHAMRATRAFLYANLGKELAEGPARVFEELVGQRAQGRPVAYLVGSCEFWSLPLRVTPAVLIPRPETELLVEAALEKIPPGADWRVADLGTGSGAIALALATERPGCDVQATDISPAAIRVARANAARLGLRGVRFHRGSWVEPLTGRFHLLASNPPYIGAGDPHLEQGDLRFEPRVALTPGADGLQAIREISRLSRRVLLGGGWLLLEHGFEQGPVTREIMRGDGYRKVRTLKDLQGHPRVTLGQAPARDTPGGAATG